MTNETITKFGYPDTLLKEYDHWVVLLRPKQVTVGSMILACKGNIERLPDVSQEAYIELAKVTSDLESVLKKTFDFQKINYLLYMMIDKHVHWHVIPRYDSIKEAFDVVFKDKGWPRRPAMDEVVEMSDVQFKELRELIRKNWPS